MSNLVKAKSWAKHFQLAYTHTGAPAVIEHKVVASGETIEQGHPVTISSEQVSLALYTSGALYGIALAPGEAGDTIPIAVGDRNNVFIGQADGATSALSCPFECDITDSEGSGEGNFEVDVGSSTEDVLWVIGKVPGDLASDATTPPRVFFQILRSQYDGLVAAR
jgi:hypothetical protein